MLSPFTREESCTSRFTTSAPRRLAASSNDTRVRVEGSVKRLATVTPVQRLARCAGVLAERAHEALRAIEQPLDHARCGSAFERQQVPQRSVRSQLRIADRDCSVSAPRCSSRHSFARKPPLEDHRGRGAVDVFLPHAPPACAARALVLERRARLQRGAALIDMFHGDGRSGVRARRRSRWRRRASRSRRTVGIIRSADDQQVRLQARGLRARSPPSRGRPARTARARRGRAGHGVADGDADALQAEVEGEDGLREALREPSRHVTHGRRRAHRVHVDAEEAPRGRSSDLRRAGRRPCGRRRAWRARRCP